jgi:tRNA pseudouridine55 synthase
VLLDKPPGRSSHRAVAELRAATGARTGHTGTLDPFASGLLVLLSGLATRLAPCFVGLDKRYRAEIDLGATTSTGDPEGELLERHPAPGRDELEARLAGLRGEVELRVPAASAVKLGGERAYRLARRGVAVEMPFRRSTVHSLELAEWSGERATLELHVSSGTYVRSIAAALGGHCVALRRTAVGPFTLAEADPGRIVPAAAALARLPAAAVARVPEAVRARVLAFEAGGGAA